jgi:hypothetical protein
VNGLYARRSPPQAPRGAVGAAWYLLLSLLAAAVLMLFTTWAKLQFDVIPRLNAATAAFDAEGQHRRTMEQVREEEIRQEAEIIGQLEKIKRLESK